MVREPLGPAARREFTPDAYDRCYLRMAQLLEFNPLIRGVMSSSWWFDPALEQISPDLVFLRRVPEENGAQLFKIGTSEDSGRDALLMSPEQKDFTRQASIARRSICSRGRAATCLVGAAVHR